LGEIVKISSSRSEGNTGNTKGSQVDKNVDEIRKPLTNKKPRQSSASCKSDGDEQVNNQLMNMESIKHSGSASASNNNNLPDVEMIDH